jgi:hypothetical protein
MVTNNNTTTTPFLFYSLSSNFATNDKSSLNEQHHWPPSSSTIPPGQTPQSSSVPLPLMPDTSSSNRSLLQSSSSSTSSWFSSFSSPHSDFSQNQSFIQPPASSLSSPSGMQGQTLPLNPQQSSLTNISPWFPSAPASSCKGIFEFTIDGTAYLKVPSLIKAMQHNITLQIISTNGESVSAKLWIDRNNYNDNGINFDIKNMADNCKYILYKH